MPNDPIIHQRTGSGKRDFTPNEISVIRERFHGWEQASASTLAAVFGVSVQRITSIVHNNRPDALNTGAA